MGFCENLLRAMAGVREANDALLVRAPARKPVNEHAKGACTIRGNRKRERNAGDGALFLRRRRYRRSAIGPSRTIKRAIELLRLYWRVLRRKKVNKEALVSIPLDFSHDSHCNDRQCPC